MRTPEEIRLECRNILEDMNKFHAEKAHVITLLHIVKELLDGIEQLEKELAAVKRERDAAVNVLRGDCRQCKHFTAPSCEEPCRSCIDGGSYRMSKIKWEWRGACPDNAEV